MPFRLALASLVLIASGTSAAIASAQADQKPRSAKDAADAFMLDSVAPADIKGDAEVTVPAETAPPIADAVSPPAPVRAPAVDAPAVDAANPGPGLDTPIGDLIADSRTKAVLDRDLPGLSDDENLAKFRGLSLRRFQPLTGGQLTDAMLATVGRHLAALKDAPASRRRTER